MADDSGSIGEKISKLFKWGLIIFIVLVLLITFGAVGYLMIKFFM